jgi:hypothetical protein
MHKIQCLRLAKGYLASNFLNSMTQLQANQHHWRSRFEDQLNISYKDWLLKKTLEEFVKGSRVEDFLGGVGGILGDQLKNVEATKDPIKKAMVANIQRKEKVRQIESKSSRTIHFLFDHGQPTRITPFTRKYARFIEGNLKQFEDEEHEKFQAYVQSIEAESIEGGNEEWNVLLRNPITFGNSPYYSFELTGLNRIAFSVADDPFYKSMKAKFVPEVLLINMKGVVKARVGHNCRRFDCHGQEALAYEEDFREAQLKINDDRRIHINLFNLAPKIKAADPKKPNDKSNSSLGSYQSSKVKGKMILLTVKINEAMKK